MENAVKKVLIMRKNPLQMYLKLLQKKNAIQERAEATIDLIENEFGEKFTENISVSAPWTVPSKTKGIEFDDENIQRKTHITRKKH